MYKFILLFRVFIYGISIIIMYLYMSGGWKFMLCRIAKTNRILVGNIMQCILSDFFHIIIRLFLVST